MRLDPPIRPRIKHRRPPQLVLREIDIPIRGHRERVRPLQARIPREYRDGLVRRVEYLNAVVFKVAGVDEAVAVGFETIRNAFLAVVRHGGFGHVCAREATVAEACSGDGVEVAAAHDAPVECCSVGAEGDAVCTEAAMGDGGFRACLGVDDFAPDKGKVAFLGADVGGVIEVSPGFTSIEVNGYDAVATFRA